jgi:hypothetical protein
VSPALTGLAAAVLVGAILAVSARDSRAAVVGLGLTLVFSPLLADPLPLPLGLAARLTGAVLGAYLLWVAVRAGGATGGSRLGWPAEALLAAAAFVVGLGTHGLGAAPLGPPEAQAAGFALAALAVVPVAAGRDIVRIGIGLFLLLEGALLVRVGLGGNPVPLEHLATGGLVAALGGSVAALAYAARSDGPGDFGLATEWRVRIRRPQDARRQTPRPQDAGVPAAARPATRASGASHE